MSIVITTSEWCDIEGKCPLCGADLKYGSENQGDKGWVCSECGATGTEEHDVAFKFHKDIYDARGTNFVILPRENTMSQISCGELADILYQHKDTPITIDFYAEYNPATDEKSWAYRAVTANFVDSNIVLINYYGGGSLFAYEFTDSDTDASGLRSCLETYFFAADIGKSVWIETVSPATYQEAKLHPAHIEIYQSGCYAIRWNKIRYWSNSLGELHRYGKKGITVEDLPEVLQKAYNDVLPLGAHKTYLVETNDGYGISCEIDVSVNYGKASGMKSEDVFNSMVAAVLKLAKEPELNGCKIYLFEEIDCDHEAIFVFPADIDAESMKAAASVLCQFELD